MRVNEVLNVPNTYPKFVALYDKGLTKIPEEYKDSICLDSFHLRDNKLEDLTNCPKEVKGSFSTKNDHLSNLKGCPQKVGEWFQCSKNRITNLKGCPHYVGGNFHCSDNHITTLVGISKYLKSIKGTFSCAHNPIKEGGVGLLLVKGVTQINYPSNTSPDFKKAAVIINKYLRRGKRGLLACQKELEEAGLGKFAKL